MDTLENDLMDELRELVKVVVKNLLINIKKYMDANKLIMSNVDYPTSAKRDDSTKWPEVHKTNLLSGILQSDYEYRDYSSVITLHKNEDKILIDEVCGFSELLDFIISNETISKRLWYEGNIEKDRNRIALFLM